MPLLYVVGGIVSVGLLIYLVLALLKPEIFA
jgi:K+-transporting ATPase KdpF subunit